MQQKESYVITFSLLLYLSNRLAKAHFKYIWSIFCQKSPPLPQKKKKEDFVKDGFMETSLKCLVSLFFSLCYSLVFETCISLKFDFSFVLPFGYL